MTWEERKSNFELINDNPYLALKGKLWIVYHEDFVENWPRHNGTALYADSAVICKHSVTSM